LGGLTLLGLAALSVARLLRGRNSRRASIRVAPRKARVRV
jgi:hypothetical protein